MPTRRLSPAEQALADAQRLVEFWRRRGKVVHVTVVTDRYGDTTLKSDLTGREPCELVPVVSPSKHAK